MTEIRIRERRPSDLDGCIEALRAVQTADGYPMQWPKEPGRWLTPTSSLGAWVALADEGDALGRVAGHVLVHSLPGKGTQLAAVGRLFVVPEARGNALGARLLDRAREWAADRGVDLVLEVVADEGSSAIALYERTGWRRTDTCPADWTTPDGAPVTLHHYALRDR